jgi:dTDP-4-dehydrorhamnose 3,5-epimerase
MRFHQDDRAIRYCDVFDVMEEGDINISVIYPGAMAAWHRHKNQTDYMFVIKGALKIGVCGDEDPDGSANVQWHYLSERDNNVLEIQPGNWHGSYNFTNEPAILVYFITQKYDPEDEERTFASPELWERKAK